MGSKCSKCTSKNNTETGKNFSFIDAHGPIENSLKDSIIQFVADDSLLTIEKIMQKFPESPQLLAKCGAHLYEKGLISQSSECFQHLLQHGYSLSSSSSLVYAQIQVQNKNYDSAIEILQKSLEINEPDHQIHAFLANIYSILEINDKSLKHITEALKINDKIADYHNSYGLCMMKEKNYQDALKHFLLAYE